MGGGRQVEGVKGVVFGRGVPAPENSDSFTDMIYFDVEQSLSL